jgi:hypothetical protein
MQIAEEVKTEIGTMSDELLISMLHDCIIQVEKQLTMACAILGELEKRQGRRHALSSRGLFRYYREINQGTLDVRAVLEFSGAQFILDHVRKCEVNMQNDLASGGVFKVVEIDEHSRPVAVERPLLQMTREQTDLLFDDGKLRPIAFQIAIVRKRISETKVAPEPPRIKTEALVDQGLIKIGWMRVNPNDLVKSLAKLGWKLEKQ